MVGSAEVNKTNPSHPTRTLHLHLPVPVQMNPPNAKCIVGMLSLLVAGVESFGSFPASLAKGTVTSVSQSVPDFGEMKVVCDHSDKGSPKVYLEVDATAWTDLSKVMSGFDVSIPVPPECPPFKHVLASYAVGQAHPPWDGRQFNGEKPGGYGQPHGAGVRARAKANACGPR